MNENSKSKYVQYGDLIYLELNTLNPLTDIMQNLVLCSDAFFDSNIYAVENNEMHKSRFLNCIFRILPGLADNDEEKKLVKHLQENLKHFLDNNSKQPNKTITDDDIETIKGSMNKKKETLQFKEKSTILVNEKIVKETEDKPVCYGEILLFEHYISGNYLKVNYNSHSTDKNLLKLSLTKHRNYECYFNIMPTFHGSQSEKVEFESELHIVSFPSDLRIAASVNPIELDNKINENYKEKNSPFPADSILGPSAVNSFVGKKFLAGLRYGKHIHNAMKLHPYCRNLENIQLKKNNIIKNGDMIRIAEDDFYLTASIHPEQSTLTLNHQKLEGYPYHNINTLFQIIYINENNESSYPIANPIQANSMKSNNPGDIFNIYLRHYPTSQYLKYNEPIGKINEPIGKIIELNYLPVAARLIHPNLSDENNQKVVKNKIINLKLYDSKDSSGQYLKSKNIMPHELVQFEINTKYFIGCKDTENHNKEILRLTRKTLVGDQNDGTNFRVLPISSLALKSIYHCESYKNYCVSFMQTCLKFKYEKNFQTKDFNKKISNMLHQSNLFFVSLMNEDPGYKIHDINGLKFSELNPNFDMQTYLREFKILDIINRFIFYFVLDDISINRSGFDNHRENLDIEQICDLISYFIFIIFVGIKANFVNYRYNSQYIRVYIHALISTKGIIIYGDAKQMDDVKYKFVSLLEEVLWDGDLDSLGQLNFYEDQILANIERQSEFQTYYIKLLDHISKSKAPNLVNSIRDNFISSFLNDEQRRQIVMPNINSNGEICLIRNDQGKIITYQVDFRKDDDKKKFVLFVFQFLKTLNLKKSLLFSSIIAKVYPLQKCEKFLSLNISDEIVKETFKETFKTMIRNAHKNFTCLPIRTIPKNITFIFKGYEEYEKKLKDIFEHFQKFLVDSKELGYYEQQGIDIQSIISNKKQILNTENMKIIELDSSIYNRDSKTYINNSEIYNPDFVRNLVNKMYQILLEDKHLDCNIILNIHENICHLLVSIIQKKKEEDTIQNEFNEAEGNKKEENSKNRTILTENYQKIFNIMNMIDDQILDLAMLQSIEKIKAQILESQNLNFVPSKITENDKLLPKGENSSNIIMNTDKDNKKISDILLEMISEEWKTKEKLYKLAFPGSVHNFQLSKTKFKKMQLQSPFSEDKVIKILSDLIEIGNFRVASSAIQVLQRKTKFEKRVLSEIKTWAFMNNQQEGNDFIVLVESLLEINQISRRLKFIAEFDQPKINNKQELITKSLKLFFENIISVLYDYKSHVKNYLVEGLTPRQIFFSRLEKSKKNINKEIPFQWNPKFIKERYQRVMRILNGHDIIIPFIHLLHHHEDYFLDIDQDFILLFRYVAIIIILYVHNNTQNQISISVNNQFITAYYDEDILQKSVDTPMMFAEMMKNNKALLKLEEKYLIDITAFTYITYFKKFSLIESPLMTDDPFIINYIRSLPFLIKANIPTDLQDLNDLMFEKFNDILAFSEKDSRMNFDKILEGRPVFISPSHAEYELPILYFVWKEFLNAELFYVKSRTNDMIANLQNKFPMSKFLKLLMSPNFEFHFQLKSSILEWINNLYYNEYINPNVFESDEEWELFIGYLLLDISAYINFKDKKWDIQVDSDSFFIKLPRVKQRIDSYNYMNKKYDLNKLLLIEYQDYVMYSEEWEKYICEHMTNIISKLIISEKEKMIDKRDKMKKVGTTVNTLFEVWITLHKKLSSITNNKKLYEKSMEIIKNILLIPEYNSYRENLGELKNLMNTSLKGLNSAETKPDISQIVSPNDLDVITSPTYLNSNLDLNNLTAKIIQKELRYEKIYREKNIRYIASCLAYNTDCIHHLIGFISEEIAEIPKSDIIFALRLLRKVIEVKNQDEKEFNKFIYDWENVDNEVFEEIAKLQKMLSDMNIVKSIFHIMHNSNDQKFWKECLLVSISLVYGGNKAVQDKFYKEFMDDPENEIMLKISKILTKNMDSIITRDAQLNKRNYVLAQNFLYECLAKNASENIIHGQNGLRYINPESKVYISEDFHQKYKELFKNNSADNVNYAKFDRQYELVTIILFFLQSLCEGHYQSFQNFLREQRIPSEGPVHPKSFNILEFMKNSYNQLLKVLNISNIQVGIKVLDLFIEVLQGDCEENLEILLTKTLLADLSHTLKSLDNDIDLLPKGFGLDNHHPELQKLKSKALTLLVNIVERSSLDTLNNIKRFVDINTLADFMASNLLKFYQIHAENKRGPPTKENMDDREIHKNPFLHDGLIGYIILKSIWERDKFENNLKQTVDKLKKKDKFKDCEPIDYMIYKFCAKNVLSIEITTKKAGQILRLYFPKYFRFDYLPADVKENFEDHVDRSNSQIKVEEFMTKIDEFMELANIEYESRNRLFGLNMSTLYSALRTVANIIALTVNLINLFSLTYIYQSTNPNNPGNHVEQDYSSYFVALAFNIVNSILALTLLLLWIFTKMKGYLTHKWEAALDEISKDIQDLPVGFDAIIDDALNGQKLSPENAKKILEYTPPYKPVWNIATQKALVYYIKRQFIYLVSCPTLVWHIIFLGICIASPFHPLICAFQLFEIIMKSDTVNRILTAALTNWKQFLWTLLLLFNVVYIYSLIGFYFLQDQFVDGSNNKLCSDEYSCFLVNFDSGLRSGGGIGDVIQTFEYAPTEKGKYFGKTLYDLSFFIFCIILLLNLIFGMIIDSFGDLRDEKSEYEEDRKNKCYICGLNRSEIEKYLIFDEHVNLEHNKWNYLAYIIYLSEKAEYAPTELSDLESYVWDNYRKNDFDWVPIGCSLSLERQYKKREKLKKNELKAMKDKANQLLDSVNIENKKIENEIKETREILVKILFSKKSTFSIGPNSQKSYLNQI